MHTAPTPDMLRGPGLVAALRVIHAVSRHQACVAAVALLPATCSRSCLPVWLPACLCSLYLPPPPLWHGAAPAVPPAPACAS